MSKSSRTRAFPGLTLPSMPCIVRGISRDRDHDGTGLRASSNASRRQTGLRYQRDHIRVRTKPCIPSCGTWRSGKSPSQLLGDSSGGCRPRKHLPPNKSVLQAKSESVSDVQATRDVRWGCWNDKSLVLVETGPVDISLSVARDRGRFGVKM